VISTDIERMLDEARELAGIHPHVVVKMPLTEDGIRATKIVSDEGIKVNVTLIFSASQALLAAKAGATYVSPFVGRLDDISEIGMNVVKT
jgi:transaldolase